MHSLRAIARGIIWLFHVMLSFDPPGADKSAPLPADRCLLAYGEFKARGFSAMFLDHLWSEESYSNGEDLFIFPRRADGKTMEFTQRLQIVLENTDLFGGNFDMYEFRGVGFSCIFY